VLFNINAAKCVVQNGQYHASLKRECFCRLSWVAIFGINQRICKLECGVFIPKELEKVEKWKQKFGCFGEFFLLDKNL
jgi:hypothetical protein